ncbi:LTA synthase family protein [Bacillus sp. S3]|uniref:LTA synthase family protein n=1 Tax=Bacillus sp. S3 TaxID=486398 RepID=UPI0011899A76|nr:sulfatase-like hydrolase/transferase [Bacillus sp. S3]QCJ44140.1 LTA synthase family protein [Bacillus sp. S3]
MKKDLLNKMIVLITTNSIAAFLILYFYKISIKDKKIEEFLYWMHDDSKRFLLYIIFITILLTLVWKWQHKLLRLIWDKFPYTKVLTKYVIVIIFTLGASIIINYVFVYFQELKEPGATTVWVAKNLNIYFAGVLYLFILLLCLVSLLGNFYVSIFLSSMVLISIGYIHYNKLSIRLEPLYPFDYKQISNMKAVIPMISQYISLPTLLIVIILAFILVVFFLLMTNIKLPKWLRAVTFIVSGFFLYAYTFFPVTFMNTFVSNSGVNIMKWNQGGTYKLNGFLFGFLANISNESFDKPDNYSKQVVLDTAKKYVDNAKGSAEGKIIHPNIIFLMSEAFWDPTKLDLEFSNEPLSNLRQLMTEHTSGNVLSPVFGGTTANVEFEALTGFTTSFLKSGSVPYQDFIDRQSFVPTIVSDLESKGYNSLAIHPFNKAFYKRSTVYNVFGIDKFYHQDNMKNTEPAVPNGYISDESLNKEILENLKKEDKPLFVHAVSMQNHMPYNTGIYKDTQIKISGLSPDLNSNLEEYTEGIRRSDQALKHLVEGIQELNEPTLFVFWGDHLPIFGMNNALYNEANYGDPNLDVNVNKYSETPLLIYSNFEIERKQLDSISPFYLGPIVYELTGLKKPSFYNLLDKLRKEMGIQALKGKLVMGNDRELIKNLTKEQKQLMDDYKLLEYDILMGNQYSLKLLYK